MTIKEQLEAKNLNTQYFDRKINKENFFRAVKTGDCNKIRLYVNNGIDINSKDEDGWTALMIASENDKKKIVKLLIELGADVKVQDDDEGKTALMHAIYVNSDENAKILLKNGSDINAKDNYGQTPFILAACSNSKTIGELLIDLGADIDAYDDQGKTAFDLGNNDFQNFLRKQEIKEKITKNRIGRINHILKSFSSSKEFGNYIGFKKNYKKLYGYEINTSRLEDCIRDYNSNSYDKILIFDVNEDILHVKPTQNTINSLFDIKIGNTPLEITDIKRLFFEKFRIILTDEKLDNYVNDYNSQHYANILTKTHDGYIRLLSVEEINTFLNIELTANYGIIEIKSKFSERFKCELLFETLDKFIKDNKSLTFNKNIKVLEDQRIQITPNEKETQTFLESYFVNCQDSLIDIKKKYFEKYKIPLSDIDIDNFILYFNSQHTANTLTKTHDGYIRLLSVEEINKFLNIELIANYGIIDIKSKFAERFKCELLYETLDKFIRDNKPLIINRNIKVLEDQRIQITPNEKEIQTFLESSLNNSFNNLDDIKNEYSYKYKIPLIDRVIDEFIMAQNSNHSKGIYKKLSNNKVQLITINEINDFIQSKLIKKYGVINLRESFLKKYDCYLPYDIICKFISNNKFADKTVKMINNNKEVQIKPSEKEINSFLWAEFLNTSDQTIKTRKIRDDYLRKYDCDLNVSDLNHFLKLIKNETHLEIEKIDDGYRIDGKISFVAKLIQGFFLKKNNDSSCSINDLRLFLEKKFDFFKNLESQFILKAIEIANSNLIDIIIKQKGEMLTKSLKFGDSERDYGKCTVCGADFSNISDDEIIKNHILQLHTSMDRNKSTLFLVKGSKSYFCCNLCNESEPLYEFQSGRIYRHLFGLCKYYSSSSSSLAITGKNSNDKIWKGSGYSNNSSLLGNSGQILRDNGQFGSYPKEDYYGDGDW